MEVIEIILLVIGGIVFIVSFLIPAKSRLGEEQKFAEENVHKMIEQELKNVKSNINDVVENSVTYAAEKTERSMERLSNEKIMAIDEYSETVLEAIHKNHNEVMFLYDMLNDKQKNLMAAVREMDQTIKEVQADGQPGNTDKAGVREEADNHADDKMPDEFKTVEGRQNTMFSEEKMFSEDGANSNSRILQLYQEGKSQVEIARELGIGVGEVKLVIDLFQGN